MTGRRSILPVVAMLSLVAAACSGPGATVSNQSSAPGIEVKSDDADSADANARVEALYWARQDSARNRFTTADVNFMTGMIAHHAQALVMAQLAPSNGASPSVQTLAARIINAQRDEIATMQRWLRVRGRPVPVVHIDGLSLTVHGADEHHMHMPGMLTQAQLSELGNARSSAFDRLFLTYMIQHHRGAITMVDHLFGVDGAAQDEAAFKLASDIHVDQVTEIARMELMLDSLPDSAQDR